METQKEVCCSGACEASNVVEDICGDGTTICHEQVTDKLSVAGQSHCATTEAYSERLSPEESVSKSAKCRNPDTAPQKSSKVKKREDKGIEHVMKSLQSIESTDEKLSALCKKYAELLEEHRTTQSSLKQTQRTLSVLAREKDQLQNDHSKAVLAKSKLEGLCRELQRHNRLVKDESAARAKEDDEKRKEVASKFQTTINDIQQQMNEHYQKNTTLREENMELTTKLKGLIEQYELREQHIEKVMQHKDLESQLLEAKLSQATLQLAEEKERNVQEKQQLVQDALESQKKVMLLAENENQLKAQVAMYQEKYDEFQQTLTKSNDVFQNFKNEMDKMAKKIKKLEKETAMYRERWENSNKALLSMAEEKTRSEKEVTLLMTKVSKLESLCRALQEERRKLTERSAPDEKLPSAIAECDTDTGTTAAAAELEAKCDDENESTTTTNGADSMPPPDDSSPCHTDDQPASPHDMPVTSEESVSTDASPTHSNDADTNSDSVVSLVTDADTCLPSEPVAAGD